MYAIAWDGLESLQPMEVARDGLPILRRVTPELLSAIAQASQLRHARYCGLSSTMGEIVVRKLLSFARNGRRALFTVSIDPHKGIARSFGERLAEAGPRRLNPIMFPHTLPSATAVTLAAQFEAHVCAVAFDGPSGLHAALSTASLLFETERVDEVLLYLCSAEWELEAPGSECPLFAIGLLLSHQPFADDCWKIMQIRGAGSDCYRSPKEESTLRREARLLSKVCLQRHTRERVQSIEIGGLLFVWSPKQTPAQSEQSDSTTRD